MKIDKNLNKLIIAAEAIYVNAMITSHDTFYAKITKSEARRILRTHGGEETVIQMYGNELYLDNA